MWYWDFAPPSGHHAKKPLSKKEIKKLQEAYSRAGEISETVKELEEKENEKTEKELEEMMRGLV